MELEVSVQLKHPEWKKLLRPYCKTVRELCGSVLAQTRLSRRDCCFEMAVVLADDAFIRELNRDYRGHDKPTNVLSFPTNENLLAQSKQLLKGISDYYLGDVVLAYETLEREAIEQQKKPRHHALHLLAHGTLHLLGYDHGTEKEAKPMESLEIKILQEYNIANPYL